MKNRACDLHTRAIKNWRQADAEHRLVLQVAWELAEAIKLALVADPAFHNKPLSELNAEAAAKHRQQDYVGAIAAYHKLFERQRLFNLHHPELFVCHSNRAAAYLKVAKVLPGPACLKVVLGAGGLATLQESSV